MPWLARWEHSSSGCSCNSENLRQSELITAAGLMAASCASLRSCSSRRCFCSPHSSCASGHGSSAIGPSPRSAPSFHSGYGFSGLSLSRSLRWASARITPHARRSSGNRVELARRLWRRQCAGETALGLAAAARWLRFALGPRRDETAVGLAAGVLVPLLVVWSLSQRSPVYVDRYFLVLLPVAIALVGAGVAQAGQSLSHRRRLGSWGSNFHLLIPLACALPAALRVHRDQAFAKEDWRQLTGVIAPGGAIASPIWRSEPEIPAPLAYYLGPDVQFFSHRRQQIAAKGVGTNPQAIHRHPPLWAIRTGA